MTAKIADYAMTEHCLASVFLALALSSHLLSAEITPRFGEATLRSETTDFRKIRVQSPWQDQHLVGGRRLAIDGDSVIERSSDNIREIRRIRSPKGVNLLWLAATDQVACFAINPSLKQFWNGELVPPVIERLDLKTMQWLPSLRIEAAKETVKGTKDQGKETTKKPRHQPKVRKQTVLSTGAVWRQTIVLLLYETRINENSGVLQAEVDGCEAICLDPQSGKTKWNTFLPWDGNESLPLEVIGTPIGHFVSLWERRPHLQHRIQWLSIWEDKKSRSLDCSRIFVCPGKKQALVCLYADSGKESWRMARIWELDRSDQVGSDVRITRFGLDGWGVGAVDEAVAANEIKSPERIEEIEESKERLVAARRAFNKRYDAYIAAGPMITNDYLEHRVFIAVARGHKSEKGIWVTDSLICEIDPEGQVETMTTVPHEVVGWPCKAFDNSVVWACEFDSFIRAAGRSLNGRQLTSIEWYREIPIWTRTTWASSNAWFHAGPDRHAACFSDQWLFRAGPAYLVKGEEHAYRFQVNVIDLATGVTNTDLTLTVPFDGKVSRPKFGLSIDSPYLLGIDGLQVEGTVLRVIMNLGALNVNMETEPPKTALEFDLKPFFTAKKAR